MPHLVRSSFSATALLSLALVAVIAAFSPMGCKKSSVRSLPESASRVMRTEIPFYDTGADPARFADMQLVGEREILAFQGGLDAAYHNQFAHDPRLDVVADIFARSLLDEESMPNAGLVEWAMRRLGIAGRIVDSSLWWTRQRSPLMRLDDVLRNAAADLPKELDAPPAAESYTFGISRFKGDASRHFQAHVVVENGAQIEPLPKLFEVGKEIVVRGRITIPHKYTTFTMMLDGAESFHIPVETAKDGRFEIHVPPIDNPGRYFIELRTLTEPRNFVSVLKLPVYVGEGESGTPDEMITDPPRNPIDMSTWAQRVAAVLNARRKVNGMKPLILDEKASAVARAAAEEDVEHWYFPVVPAREALEKEGIRISRGDEFWSSFESLDEMLWTRFRSPYFRYSVLDDRYTHLAVGFAKDRESMYSRYVGILYLYNDIDRRDRERAEALALFDRATDEYGSRGDTAAGNDIYAAKLEKALDEASEVSIAHDANLDTLAEAYAKYGDLDLDSALEQWMLWQLGETGRLFRVERRLVRTEEVSRFEVAEVKAAIEKDEELASRHYAFGVSRIPKPSGSVLETVVIVSREVELDPFPKHYKAGDRLVVSGVFTAKPESAHFMMNFPEGLTTSSAIELNGGKTFGYSIVAPSSPGRYMIEISVPDIAVEDEAVYFSRRSAVFVPIWVDAEAPNAPAAALLEPKKNPADRATWADTVLAVYNAERAAHGLPALRRNRVADAVLAEQLLLDQSTIRTPTFHDIQDDIASNGAGYTLSVMGNDDFFGNDLVACAERKLEVPAWREQILSPKTTMFGFAVSKEGYETLQMLLADESEQSELRPDDATKSGVALEMRRALPPVLGELNSAKLAEVAQKNLKEVGNCFNEIAKYEDEFGGKVVFDLAIGSLGNAVAVTLTSSTVGTDRVETCIAKAIRGWTFPLSIAKGVGFGTLGFELSGKGKRRTIKIY